MIDAQEVKIRIESISIIIEKGAGPQSDCHIRLETRHSHVHF